MKINTEIIKKLNPCNDRFNNYIKHYLTFNGNLEEFLSLDNITYSDKVWVFTHLATPIQNVIWSLLCAEFVSHLNIDERVSLALKATINYIENPSSDTAYAAANAAYAAYAAINATYVANYDFNNKIDQENINLMLMLETLEKNIY